MPVFPLLRLVECNIELLASVLCHLDVVQLRSLSATCRLLRKVTRDEALLPEVQQAVAHNTQGRVQRNIAARSVRLRKQATPALASFSPCGQLVAWKDQHTIVVRHRHSGCQVSSDLPALPNFWRTLLEP